VDLPAQEDQTIPVELPSAFRSAGQAAPGGPARPAGADDRPPAPASFFASAGTPARDSIAVPPARRDGNAEPRNSGPAGNAVASAGSRPWDPGPPAGSTGRPWGSAPGGSANQSWNAAPVGGPRGSTGQPWGSAQAAGATAPVPGAAPTRGAGPAAGPVPAAARRRRSAGRTALVVLGVLAVIAVVVVALIVRHHRASLGTASSQAGSGAAATPGRGPVLAAGGAASTGALPAGFRTVTVPAAKLGTNAGFAVAIPDSWNVSFRGLAMYAEAPGNVTFLQIDLTTHTKADMVAEANYLAQITTQQQHKFPGYRAVSIRRANIRGGSGAAWEFTWQNPAVGTMRSLDLLVIASTRTGQQSYALYMSAPAATWNRHLAAFDEETHTFQPTAG